MRCNRCTLQDLELLARRAGGHVVIQAHSASPNVLGEGYDVFILYPGDPRPVHAGLLMTLGATCACGKDPLRR